MKHLSILAWALCSFSFNNAFSAVIHGEEVSIGKGHAHVYVKTDDVTGHPTAIGVAMGHETMEGLPSVETTYSLKLPIEVEPYQEIHVNWNPGGHEPPGVYDVPHFDFHFYTIPKEDREAMTCTGPDALECMRNPIPGFIPPFYIPTPAAVPFMGWHWLDSKSPELNGKPFTWTFIYGFYRGEMSFLEPMVTREFLMSHHDVNTKLSMPRIYPFDGHYPKKFMITFDALTKIHHVELSHLKFIETKLR